MTNVTVSETNYNVSIAETNQNVTTTQTGAINVSVNATDLVTTLTHVGSQEFRKQYSYSKKIKRTNWRNNKWYICQ
jgi:hypothetical protein